MASPDIPKTMLAWQKQLPSKVPVRIEVPVPSAQADEVLVKIHAAGVCHSDYAVREMETMPAEFKTGTTKFTFGHEGCGEVVAIGSGISRFKTSDMVAITCAPGCGGSMCPECSGGVPQICQKGPRYGGGKDGFFAAYVTVRENSLVKLPRGVSPIAGAVATDACMTAYNAVVNRARVRKSDTILLFGLGGLGFNALQIILYIGARVIVVDKRQIVLDEAINFGVQREDIVPLNTTDLSKWLNERNLRVDTTIDFVAMPETLKAAVDCVRLAGTCVMVGLLSPELTFRTATIVRKQLNILGSYGGTCSDIEACLDLIANGVLIPQVTTASMRDFPTILADLHNGKVKSRIALIPEGMD